MDTPIEEQQSQPTPTTTQPDAAESPAKPAPAADSVEARREARRRRILENSSNRLAKISGREEPTEVGKPAPSSTSIVHPDPDMERDTFEPVRSHFPHSRGPVDENDLLNNMFAQMQATGGANNPFAMFEGLMNASSLDAPQLGSGNLFAGFAGLSGGQQPQEPQQPPPPPPSRLVRLMRTKLHIGAIAVLTYLLATNDLMFRSHVFTLFLLWEAVELLLLGSIYPEKEGMYSVLLMVSGVNRHRSAMAMNWFKTGRRVLKDVAVFVFFFVVAHLLWQSLVAGLTMAAIFNVDEASSGSLAEERLVAHSVDAVREELLQRQRQRAVVVDDAEEMEFEF